MKARKKFIAMFLIVTVILSDTILTKGQRWGTGAVVTDIE